MSPATREGWAIGSILALAVVTRFYGFADAPLRADEFYTVDQTIQGTYRTKPAYYFLTGLLFQRLGVSEFSARLVAVLFGVLGIAAVYGLGRSLFGPRVAWMSALLTIACYWHLDYSQFSRFYSGVFFFGAISYWAFYRALARGSIPLLVLALVSNGLGILFHTTSAVVPVTCALFALGALLGRPKTASLSLPIARIYVVACAAAFVVAIPFILPMLRHRYTTGASWGYDTPKLALQLVRYAGPSLSVAALGGIFLVRRAEPLKATYLAVGVGVAVAFLLGMSRIGNVRPDYVFFALPLLFVAAACLCSSLQLPSGSASAAPLVVLAVLLAAMLPDFASHYSGRRTFDERVAIRFVERSCEPGDKIVDLLGGGGYYWTRREPIAGLPGTAYHDDADWTKLLEPYQGSGQRVWVLVPMQRREINATLRRWLGEHASLVWQRQATRFDYSVEGVQVFLKR